MRSFRTEVESAVNCLLKMCLKPNGLVSEIKETERVFHWIHFVRSECRNLCFKCNLSGWGGGLFKSFFLFELYFVLKLSLIDCC